MSPDRTIYVDMDDVLCATCRGLLRLLEDEFGRRVAYEEVHDFDLGKSFGMSADQIEEFMARVHQRDILAPLEPLPGATATLGAWVEEGFHIRIMTGRPPATRSATEEWLGRHRFPYHDLTFVDKYGRLGAEVGAGEAMSLAALASERFCLAVEDSAATATFLAEHAVAPVALLDRPWNRRGAAAGVRRMADWTERFMARRNAMRRSSCWAIEAATRLASISGLRTSTMLM